MEKKRFLFSARALSFSSFFSLRSTARRVLFEQVGVGGALRDQQRRRRQSTMLFRRRWVLFPRRWKREQNKTFFARRDSSSFSAFAFSFFLFSLRLFFFFSLPHSPFVETAPKPRTGAGIRMSKKSTSEASIVALRWTSPKTRKGKKKVRELVVRGGEKKEKKLLLSLSPLSPSRKKNLSLSLSPRLFFLSLFLVTQQ